MLSLPDYQPILPSLKRLRTLYLCLKVIAQINKALQKRTFVTKLAAYSG